FRRVLFRSPSPAVENGDRILGEPGPLVAARTVRDDVPIAVVRTARLCRHVIRDAVGVENLGPQCVVVRRNTVLVRARHPAFVWGKREAHTSIDSVTAGPSPVNRLSCDTVMVIGVDQPVTSKECPSAVVSAVSVLTPSVAVTR